MRLRVLTLCVLGACSVPDKQPVDTDAGVDAAIPPGPDGEPNTMITDGPGEFSPTAAATFRFASDIPTATFMCTIDGETPLACSSPYTRTLNDGPHTFSVRAVNTDGNSDDTPAEHPWSIDTAMPETMMITAPPALDNSVMVRFTFDSNERNIVFDCSLDGATYTACVSDAEIGPIGDGAHSFAVRARDRAGNVDSSPAIHAWNVDTSTPDTQLASGPTGASGSTSATFSFVSPDAGSGATFQCSLDGAAMADCTSPREVTNLGEGPHTFSVRVRDAVGNFDPTPAMRTWNVDLSTPDTMITSGPSGTVPAATAAFGFMATEDDVAYECSLDGAAFAGCTAPVTFTNLGQGSHTFAVRARDLAGHTDASPATRTWSVDTVAPNVTFTDAPADGATTGPRVTFAFTTNEGTAECSVDGGTFVACASPQTYNLTAVTHVFSVRVTDAGGNMTTGMRTWTVACAAPDAAGAVGLLHLDDTGQTLSNATGGGTAVLGDTDQNEPADPTPTAGRFGGGLVFMANQDDRVTWPAAIPASSELTVELWVHPGTAGDLFVTSDGRVALRVAASGRVEATVAGTTVMSAPITAGAWHRVLVAAQQPTLRMWVDGARTEATGLTLPTPLALDSIRLGGGSFGGLIDEVWVAQTALTSDDSALARYCPL
ncbi:MAG: hypothetical protein H0T42_28560 [Deltaproteobacteria bacterium]|nr:hypothetical protein [Deltaproteobacteria bacterium]